MKILVTGGRDYKDRDRLFAALYAVHFANNAQRLRDGDGGERATVIVHGACRSGADRFAGEWAREVGVEQRAYPVDHAIDGPWPAAGPRRNLRMLRAELDGLTRVLAFPGGRGTASMCTIARRNGVDVVEVTG